MDRLQNKWRFIWHFTRLALPFTLGECRLHLGNTKKNGFFFGISLDLINFLTLRNENYSHFLRLIEILHYLCRQITHYYILWTRKL